MRLVMGAPSPIVSPELRNRLSTGGQIVHERNGNKDPRLIAVQRTSCRKFPRARGPSSFVALRAVEALYLFSGLEADRQRVRRNFVTMVQSR